MATVPVQAVPADLVVQSRLKPATRLAPRSVVVIGKRSRRWPKPENRLAHKLRATGHHVVRTTFHKEFAHA
jgi:hypothetical protein